MRQIFLHSLLLPKNEYLGEPQYSMRGLQSGYLYPKNKSKADETEKIIKISCCRCKIQARSERNRTIKSSPKSRNAYLRIQNLRFTFLSQVSNVDPNQWETSKAVSRNLSNKQYRSNLMIWVSLELTILENKTIVWNEWFQNHHTQFEICSSDQRDWVTQS